MIKNKEEIAAQKQLEKFQKAYTKLLAKFPNVSVYGDRDGDPIATIRYGEGYGEKFIELSLPSYAKDAESSK
jgi:hypothetical protein